MSLSLNFLSMPSWEQMRTFWSSLSLNNVWRLLNGHWEKTPAEALHQIAWEGEAAAFADHYQTYLASHVIDYEAKRIAALKSFGNRIYVMALACLFGVAPAIGFLFVSAMSGDIKDLVLFALLIGISAGCYWTAQPVKHYKLHVKGHIFPLIFSYFGPQFSYSPDSEMSLEDLEASDILPSYDRYHSEDYIRGAYRDVSLEICETTLWKEVQNGRNRSTVKVFQGLFVVMGMNKNFSGQTLVTKDQGRLGNWFSGLRSGYETVRLEDIVFEKEFEVLSTDQVEARYLLTTSFMERLLKLSELFGKSEIQASFYNNRLLLMIPSGKNHFETASIFQPATFQEDIQIILKEMQLIFQIIDILKLNEKTGL
jgi:hypothetical protein